MNSHLEKFLQVIREPLAALLPGMKVDVSEPYHPSGVWIINIHLDDYHLMVQFKEGLGFGLTAGDEDWGTSVDEVISDAGAAVIRVLELLRAKGRTIPTTTLQGLRAEKSQREVAEAMAIKQPSYARMENDELSNLRVQTIQKIVAASKGKLHLLVETLHGQYFILNSTTRKEPGVKESECHYYSNAGTVPLHLVSLTPKQADNSFYGKVWKDAFKLSSKSWLGSNVNLIWPDNCRKMKAEDRIGGFSYTACLMERHSTLKNPNFIPDPHDVSQSLRLVK